MRFSKKKKVCWACTWKERLVQATVQYNLNYKIQKQILIFGLVFAYFLNKMTGLSTISQNWCTILKPCDFWKMKTLTRKSGPVNPRWKQLTVIPYWRRLLLVLLSCSIKTCCILIGKTEIHVLVLELELGILEI